MAFLKSESKVIDNLVRDFLEHYDDRYDSSRNVQIRPGPSPRVLMRTLHASDVRRGEFYREFEKRLNAGRDPDKRFAVSGGSALLKKLSGFRIGSGVEVIGVYPKREPDKADAEAVLQHMRMHRIFKITPEKGLVFVPFKL